MKKSTLKNNILLPVQLILIIAFLEGFVIMGVELIGAKIAGPYYGSSFFVWTSIIGVTLFSLTAGYFVGGHLSSKYKTSKLIPIISLLAGFFIFLMPNIAKPFFTIVLDLPILLAVVLATVSYLLLPLFFVGMLSPCLILELSKHKKDAGESSGIIYFVSTIAGIIAALVFGFLLLPKLEIVKNVYLLSIIILLVGSVAANIYKEKRLKYTAVFLTLFVVILIIKEISVTTKYPRMSIKVVHQSEGLLGQIKVVDNYDSKSRTLSVNNSSQTKTHFTGRSLFPYVYYISTYLSHKEEGSEILLAGVGGGSLIYELSLFDFEIEVVELDKRIVDVAKQYFLMPKKDFKVNIDDARHFIRKTNKTYDAIILDMSAGETMPSNVYTVEAFRNMKKLLKPEGNIVLHFVSINSEEGMLSVKSIGKTLSEAGFNVQLLNTKPSSENPSPFVFIASLEELDFDEMNFYIDPDLPKSLIPDKNNLTMDVNFEEGYLLTDNKPLLDVIHKPVVLTLRRHNIESIINPLSKNKVSIFK